MVLLSAACARVPPRTAAGNRASGATASRRAQACAARGTPAPEWFGLPDDDVPVGFYVVRVAIRGNGRVPGKLVRDGIHAKVGAPLDLATVAADIRRIWQLEAFSDVRVESTPEPGGVALVYVVAERPLVGSVFVEGDRDAAIGVHPGDLYEPARTKRRAEGFVSTARDKGHLHASASVRARAVDAHTVDLCVTAHRGPRFVIDRIEFDGNEKVDDATLLAALHTGDGKVNAPGRPYRADLLEKDALWLDAVFLDRGMLSAKVHPPRATFHDKKVSVHIRVDEGPVFQLRSVAFRGKLLASPATYRKLLGVKPGRTFDRSKFMAGISRIRSYHLWRGHKELDVVPETKLDVDNHTVEIVLRVEKPK